MNKKNFSRLLVRLVCFLVFLISGIVISAAVTVFIYSKEGSLGVKTLIVLWAFAFGLLIANIKKYRRKDSGCRHAKSDILDRVKNTWKMPILILTYEEILSGVILGQVLLWLHFSWKMRLGMSLLLLGGLLFTLGFLIILWPKDEPCLSCNAHVSPKTQFWYKPLSGNYEEFTQPYKDQAKNYAEYLSTWCQNEQNEGGVFILNGEQGTGKSSFKNLILHLLWEKEREKFIIIEISPWETVGPYGLQRHVVSEMIAGLNRHYALGSYQQEWSGLLEALGQDVHGFRPLAWLMRFLAPKDSIQEFKRIFKSLHHHIIIVLEDLERFNGKELSALLRLIDEFRQFPNLHLFIPTNVAACVEILESMSKQHPGEKLFRRTLPGPQKETYIPDADERGNILLDRHAVLFSELKENATDKGYFELETALRQSGRKLDNFRDLNAFSLQLEDIHERLSGEVYWPDIIYAEVMRVIDPRSFSRIFTLESSIYSELPEAHNNFPSILSAAMSNSKERESKRTTYANKIIEKANDQEWAFRIFKMIFGAIETDNITQVTRPTSRIQSLQDIKRDDKQSGRLKHPDILRDYLSQIAQANKPLRDFVNKFDSLESSQAINLFWDQLLIHLNQFRQNGSEKFFDFFRDLIPLYFPAFKNNPDKSVQLLIHLSTMSGTFRLSNDPFSGEIGVIANFMWALLLALPAERQVAILRDVISHCKNPLLLPEFWNPLVQPTEKWWSWCEQRTGVPNAKFSEEFKSVDFGSDCAKRFEELLRTPDAFNGIETEPNNFLIFRWFCSLSDDKKKDKARQLNFDFFFSEGSKKDYQDGLREWLEMAGRIPGSGGSNELIRDIFGESREEDVKNKLDLS